MQSRIPMVALQENRDARLNTDGSMVNCYVEENPEGLTAVKRGGMLAASSLCGGIGQGAYFFNGRPVFVGCDTLVVAYLQGLQAVSHIGGPKSVTPPPTPLPEMSIWYFDPASKTFGAYSLATNIYAGMTYPTTSDLWAAPSQTQVLVVKQTSSSDWQLKMQDRTGNLLTSTTLSGVYLKDIENIGSSWYAFYQIPGSNIWQVQQFDSNLNPMATYSYVAMGDTFTRIVGNDYGVVYIGGSFGTNQFQIAYLNAGLLTSLPLITANNPGGTTSALVNFAAGNSFLAIVRSQVSVSTTYYLALYDYGGALIGELSPGQILSYLPVSPSSTISGLEVASVDDYYVLSVGLGTSNWVLVFDSSLNLIASSSLGITLGNAPSKLYRYAA